MEQISPETLDALSRLPIYIILFIIVIVLAGVIIFLVRQMMAMTKLNAASTAQRAKEDESETTITQKMLELLDKQQQANAQAQAEFRNSLGEVRDVLKEMAAPIIAIRSGVIDNTELLRANTTSLEAMQSVCERCAESQSGNERVIMGYLERILDAAHEERKTVIELLDFVKSNAERPYMT